jgi:SepF-like predicted cell division protein (DUF552 family)
MNMAFSLKKLLGKGESSDEFVEIDLESAEKVDSKVVVKPFVLKVYDDINEVLNVLREGYTIAVIDIKPMKQKDIIELKRAVAKIKKTVDAVEGSIAGFGENIIIATPKFAQIHKEAPKKEKRADFINDRY